VHFAVNLLITIFMKNKFLIYIHTLISFLLILLFFDHLPTYAQEKEPGAEVTIVILMTGNYKEYQEVLYGFEKMLQESDIKPNIIEIVKGLNDEISNKDLIDEIKRNNPHLIFIIGSRASTIIQDIKDIPIVFSTFRKPDINYSEDQGTINNNATGVTFSIPVIKQFSIYKKIIPKLNNLLVIYSSDENEHLIEEAQIAASDLGFELISPKVSSEKAALRSVNNLISFIDAIWLIVDHEINSKDAIRRISLEGFKNNIPVMAPSTYFAELAAFVVSADYEDIGRQSGDIAVKILQDGIHPSSIPVESPQKLNICINKNTMDAIGLAIPDSIGIHNIIIK